MENEINLLANEDYKRPLEDASTGQRFMNYLIDTFSFFFFLFAILIAMITTNWGYTIFVAIVDWLLLLESELLANLLLLLLYGFYIAAMEILTKGKTLGKMLTRTRAVYNDGTSIRPLTALLRGLYRAVPLEAVSAFGDQPWHDKWTGTRVVRERSLE